MSVDAIVIIRQARPSAFVGVKGRHRRRSTKVTIAFREQSKLTVGTSAQESAGSGSVSAGSVSFLRLSSPFSLSAIAESRPAPLGRIGRDALKHLSQVCVSLSS